MKYIISFSLAQWTLCNGRSWKRRFIDVDVALVSVVFETWNFDASCSWIVLLFLVDSVSIPCWCSVLTWKNVHKDWLGQVFLQSRSSFCSFIILNNAKPGSHTWYIAAGMACDTVRHLLLNHNLFHALTAGLSVKLNWVQLRRQAGSCWRLWVLKIFYVNIISRCSMLQ